MTTMWAVIIGVMFSAVGALAQNPTQTWTLATGRTITGIYMSHDYDALVLRDAAGRSNRVDLALLSLEQVRELIPTIDVDVLENPPKKKGLYNSKALRDALLENTYFVEVNAYGSKYGRLYAFDMESLYFESPAGRFFSYSTHVSNREKELKAYLARCMPQISREVNLKRMRELGPMIQTEKMAELERRVRSAEETVAHAGERPPGMPAGSRFVNGTWVYP